MTDRPDPPRRSTPDLVIFDCDGVLVDSERITLAIMGQRLRAHGWDLSDDQVKRRYKGGHIDDIKRDLQAAIGRPVPDFIDLYRRHMFDAFQAGVPPIAGIHAVLDALDAAGTPACVASNGPHKKMDATLASAGLAHRFAGRIYSADDVARPKPAPDLFLHAAADLGADPARCAVIDDSPQGVAAAVAAGMLAIGFSDLTPPDDLAQAGAAAVITELAQLPALLSPGRGP